jgi:hypothetical protein
MNVADTLLTRVATLTNWRPGVEIPLHDTVEIYDTSSKSHGMNLLPDLRPMCDHLSRTKDLLNYSY